MFCLTCLDGIKTNIMWTFLYDCMYMRNSKKGLRKDFTRVFHKIYLALNLLFIFACITIVTGIICYHGVVLAGLWLVRCPDTGLWLAGVSWPPSGVSSARRAAAARWSRRHTAGRCRGGHCTPPGRACADAETGDSQHRINKYFRIRLSRYEVIAWEGTERT